MTESEEKKAADLVVKWLRRISMSDAHEKKWRDRAEKVVNRYRDKRESGESSCSRFNILFSMTEVLKGIVYQQPPIPDVRRRFNDPDPVGKAASEILNRALSYCIDKYDLDGLMQRMAYDVLLPGRATALVKYKPKIVATGEEGQEVEQVIWEDAPYEYVDWCDVRFDPAKKWEDVKWMAIPEKLTRDECIGAFGEELGNAIQLTYKAEDNAHEDGQPESRALVWKIWDKRTRRVLMISPGYEQGPLSIVDDPLKLEDFFPIPEPLYSVWGTETMVPIPEFVMYQDQANELDDLTARIQALVQMLRVRGVYDKTFPELGRLLSAPDGTLIPVESFANLAEKGGLNGGINMVDIDPVIRALPGLYQQREIVKQTIYEVTGISDIVRGTSDVSETATAQQLKSQWGNVRIAPRQKAVQKFARNLLRIQAEIICEHFAWETISQMTGITLPSAAEKQQAQMMAQQAQIMGQQPDPKLVEIINQPSSDEVMALLKDDKLRSFRVDIETDSTIAPNADAEQRNRIELLTAVGSFMTQMAPAVQTGAISQEAASELLLFGVRSFKAGPQIEEALQTVGQAQPQGPTPEQQKAQEEIEKGKQELQNLQIKVKNDEVGVERQKVGLMSEQVKLEKLKNDIDTAAQRIINPAAPNIPVSGVQ